MTIDSKKLLSLIFWTGVFALVLRPTLDFDLWWHLKNGQWLLSHGPLRRDIYSFTVPGAPLVSHEPLFDALVWLVWRAAGLGGLLLATGVLSWLTLRVAAAVAQGRFYTSCLTVLFCYGTLSTFFTPRPQLLSLFFMALFVALLDKVRRGADERLLYWLVPATLLWANSHGGYLAGPALALAYAVDRPHRKTLLRVFALSLLASFINPNGPGLILYPLEHGFGHAHQIFIQEWKSPDFHWPGAWPLAGAMGLTVLGFIERGKKVTGAEKAVFFATAAAALFSWRHAPLFALANAPAFARGLEAYSNRPALAALGARIFTERSGRRPETAALFLVAGIVLAGLLMWSGFLLRQNDGAVRVTFPQNAVDFLESKGLSKSRLFHEYEWGGYLLWRGVPVFIDGRSEMYGDAFLRKFLETRGAFGDWPGELARWNVEGALLRPGTRLAILLGQTPGWERLYEDGLAVIYWKGSPGNVLQ